MGECVDPIESAHERGRAEFDREDLVIHGVPRDRAGEAEQARRVLAAAVIGEAVLANHACLFSGDTINLTELLDTQARLEKVTALIDAELKRREAENATRNT